MDKVNIFNLIVKCKKINEVRNKLELRLLHNGQIDLMKYLNCNNEVNLSKFKCLIVYIIEKSDFSKHVKKF